MPIWTGEKFDQDPTVNRFLTEGICPNDHSVLVRTHEFICVCINCDFSWRSKRVPFIFPSDGAHKNF